MSETSAAPTMSVLAELVLIAMRKNLPAPKYTTVANGEVYQQINLSFNTRAELDAWNAEFGNARVQELPPRPDAQDVLLTTMYGGSLLGWAINLNVRVPLPLSAEVLAALGNAARSDAAAVLVAEAVAVLDEPKAEPKRYVDNAGRPWKTRADGQVLLAYRDLEDNRWGIDLDAAIEQYGLVEVTP